MRDSDQMPRFLVVMGEAWPFWRHVVISGVTLVFGLGIALPFWTPTAYGYFQLPGVVLAVIVALVSLICFVLCPQRPRLPKVIAGLLCALAIACACGFVGYYWHHLLYGT